jgi:hypothetical protein
VLLESPEGSPSVVSSVPFEDAVGPEPAVGSLSITVPWLVGAVSEASDPESSYAGFG